MAVGITKATKKALTKDLLTEDGFNNFFAKLGMQTDNIAAKGTYTHGSLLSRNRQMLDAMYRSSWLVGQVVDTVAEDMTKEGISISCKWSPDKTKYLLKRMNELAIMQSICSTLKWSRLYGGAVAVILIDGANYEKPFNVKNVGKGQFKGLLVLDRWQVQPSFGDLITEVGPNMGMPKYYTVDAGIPAMSGYRIHYSRLIRLDGIELPYWIKQYDNFWGMSVVERLFDRLIAFDSSTTGAAQLMYRAYLRVVKVDGLRQALATGGKTESAVIKQFQYIRMMQSMEGITLLDGKDDFSTHPYSFGGIADVLREFGQQISGACNIPLVRLFGQSPAGFSTGDTDLRNYYDGISKNQTAKLSLPFWTVLQVLSYSEFGEALPDDFSFDFNPLWDLGEQEKSTIASTDAMSVNGLFTSGILDKKTALKELAQNSKVHGRFSNITEDVIKNAKEEPPEHQNMSKGLLTEPEEKVDEAKPDHQLTGLEALKAKLLKKPVKEKEVEDVKVIPKQSLEILEKEIGNMGFSFESLENELKDLNPKTIEAVENDLQAFINKTKTIEALENSLIEYKLKPQSIEMLLNALAEIKPIIKKMPVTDRGNSFEKAVRHYFRVEDKDNFEEADHPRAKEGAKAGQFVKKGSGSTGGNKVKAKQNYSLMMAKKDKDGKWVSANGKALPKHLSKIKIPPAWENVKFSQSEKSKVWVTGKDSVGRPQVLYSPSHQAKAAVEKFARINELDKKYDSIMKQVDKNKDKEEAILVKLIAATAIRPGSDSDTKAKVKAYGATTLQKRHVVKREGKIYLDFIGKKGVHINLPVEDKEVAKTLWAKAKQAKHQEGNLFNTDRGKLLKFVHSLDGGGFKTKDFRTLQGTKQAMRHVEQMSAPTNAKEYKKQVREVAKKVAEKLGNTHTVCLQAYINPSVFAEWRMRAGV